MDEGGAPLRWEGLAAATAQVGPESHPPRHPGAEACLGWKRLLLPVSLELGANSSVGKREEAHQRRPSQWLLRELCTKTDLDHSPTPLPLS